MSFFSESAKASPLERRMAARAGAAAGKPLDEDIQKNRSGGDFISIRKYQDSDNATFVNKFVLCEKVAYLES